MYRRSRLQLIRAGLRARSLHSTALAGLSARETGLVPDEEILHAIALTLALTLALFGCGCCAEIAVWNPRREAVAAVGARGRGGGGVRPRCSPTQLVPGSLWPGRRDERRLCNLPRATEALAAVKLESGAMPTKILDKPGTVINQPQRRVQLVRLRLDDEPRRPVVLERSRRHAAHRHRIYAENMVSASEDGAFFVYTSDVTATTRWTWSSLRTIFQRR